MQTLILPSEALGTTTLSDDTPNSQPIEIDRKEQSFHCFMIGTIGALIDESLYCEIIDYNNICAIPLTPPWFKGIVNLRGNSVPIIDLNQYYGHTDAQGKKAHIITVGKGQHTCGIKIDHLPHKAVLHEDDMITRAISLPPSMNHHIDNVYEKDGLWVQLNPDKLFKHVFDQLH